MASPSNNPREAYLKDQDVPKFVNSFVESLLEKKPVGSDAVAQHAVKHAIESMSSPEAKIAAVSDYTEQPDGGFKTPSRQVQPAEHDASPSVRQGTLNSVNNTYSSIAHNMSIDVLNQSTLAGSHHRVSIVSYNMGAMVKGQPWFKQHAKVCVTIGPASAKKEQIRELVDAGASTFRLNFSHGSRENFREIVENIRAIQTELGRELTVVMDTAGPEIRLGNVPNGAMTLKKGDTLKLSTDDKFAENPTEDTVWVDYKDFPKIVNYSSRVLLSEGNLEMRVTEMTDDLVTCTIETKSFELTDRRNVNLPGIVLNLPIIDEKDKRHIDFAIDELGVDGIFLSFVQSIDDVKIAKDYLGDRLKKNGIFIFAKIENQEGLQNFDDIVNGVDGIMVARGDLGAELPVKKLFLAQKMMISKCNAKGKPVIVASQLLESMVSNPHPTRAEANDIANAVLDGTDCLQLSAETAVGEHPTDAVTTLMDIAFEAHAYVCQPHFFQSMLAVQPRPMQPEESVASSAVNSAQELGAKAIIALTTSGSSAQMVSKYLPPCPVVAVCKSRGTAKKLNLVRGVTPYYYDGIEKDERLDRIEKSLSLMVEIGMVEKGDYVVAVHADRTTGFANLARVIEV